MVRLLILLLGMLTTRAPSARSSFLADEEWHYPADPPGPDRLDADDRWPAVPDDDDEPEVRRPVRYRVARVRRRRRVPRWLGWGAAAVLVGLVFRKAMAWAVIAALSGFFHMVGINLHLPDLKFGWPWQAIGAATTTDLPVGPWVLQSIEGISKPALGTENFTFVFTHKVDKSVGFWPCWYSSTFNAAGRASATVDLNPGAAWWAPSTGHFLLQVLSKPATGSPGTIAVSLVLPAPQLPQSVHDVTVDDTWSHPIDTQHSWTYPGLGCGALIRPQFAQSVLYAQAQNLAFYQATHNTQVTRPLINAAQAEAAQIIRYNFIQPTVNALGYMLTRFSIRWAGAP